MACNESQRKPQHKYMYYNPTLAQLHNWVTQNYTSKPFLNADTTQMTFHYLEHQGQMSSSLWLSQCLMTSLVCQFSLARQLARHILPLSCPTPGQAANPSFASASCQRRPITVTSFGTCPERRKTGRTGKTGETGKQVKQVHVKIWQRANPQNISCYMVHTEILASFKRTFVLKRLFLRPTVLHFNSMSCVHEHAHLCPTAGLMYLDISFLHPDFPTWSRLMITDQHFMSEKYRIPQDSILFHSIPEFKDLSNSKDFSRLALKFKEFSTLRKLWYTFMNLSW